MAVTGLLHRELHQPREAECWALVLTVPWFYLQRVVPSCYQPLVVLPEIPGSVARDG